MLGPDSPNNLSLDEIFPAEVIRIFLEHLTRHQRVGVQRVNSLWRFLNSSLLNDVKDFVNIEWPFLVAGRKITDAEYLAIFENQPKIYSELAKEQGLSSEHLHRASLEAFCANKDNPQFMPEQKTFLNRLAITSGVSSVNGIESIEDKARIFRVMAKIGNLQMLEKWNNDESIPAYSKGWAFIGAAKHGQLSCVQYLIKEAGTEISSGNKGWVLKLAAFYGHLSCVQHLIETCEDISEEDKKEALRLAGQKSHKEVADYLENHLKDSLSFHADSLIFTGMGKNEKMSDTSREKRKLEENNQDEKPKNKKFKLSPENEAHTENENKSRWPYCLLM